MMKKQVAFLFSFALIVGGCGESGSGNGGSGGVAGAGGNGGSPAPPPSAVDQTCRDICANEAEGFSCFQGPPDLVQGCYEQCLRDYQAYVPCEDEWIAIYDCLLDVECADLLGDCDSAPDPLNECIRLANNRFYCETTCPELDIVQCEQDTTECEQLDAANRYCASNCPAQDREECVQQYVATGSCGVGGTGGTGGGPSPVITMIAWKAALGCTPRQQSGVVVTITATDPDTDAGALIYSGSVGGCNGPIDGAISTISCPNVAPYPGTVIVSDPDGNNSTPVAFDVGVCETEGCTTDPDTCG